MKPDRRKQVVPAALLIAGLGLPAIAEDWVVLANGDTLTGEIVERDDRGVVIKHPALGTIAISKDRIRSIKAGDSEPELIPQAQPQPDQGESPKQLDSEQADTPSTPGADVDAQAVQGEAERAAAREKPSTLRWLLDEWNNQLTLGLNGAGGNTDTQNYYAKFATNYEDGRDRWAFNTQWFYGIADGEVVQNQYDARLTKDWLQKDSPWFFFIKGQYRYDANRDWENRAAGFGGGGYTLAKTDDLELNTRIGFGGTYEFGDINEFTPEAFFGGSVVKWQITERSTIAGETIYYPSLEETSNFRIESSLEWVYKLEVGRGMSLKLGLENEYDSNTPNDAGNSDLRYYGAVVLSF